MKEKVTFDEKGYMVTSMVSDYEDYDVPVVTIKPVNKLTE